MGALLGSEAKANTSNLIHDEVNKEVIKTTPVIKLTQYIIRNGLIRQYYYTELKCLEPVGCAKCQFENNATGWFILPTLSITDGRKLREIVYNYQRMDVVADKEGRVYKITPYILFDNTALTPLDLSHYWKVV